MGQTHGLTLTYDSLRADPRPIFHVGYDDVDPEAISIIPDGLQVVARVGVFVDNVEVVSPGFDQPGEFGLLGGENFFSIPTGSGPLDAAVQVDLSDQPTGVYPYRFSSGIRNLVETPWGTFLAGGQTITSNELIHINAIDSPFGSGWGIDGLQEIVEGPEGSVAIIDGDGSELRWRPGTRQVRDLLIQDTENNAVLRFDGISGGLLEEFVSSGSGSGGLNGPHNPTFGPDGNLYVISGNTQQILRYDGETGDFIDVFVDRREGGFTGAAELAFDPGGNLYAATVAAQGVLRYDPQGQFIGAIAGSAAGVRQACGIEIGVDGNLYVLDTSGAERILRFDPVSGELIDVFVAPGNIPNSCDFDFGPEGDIFVTSLDRADVRRFSGVDGSFLGVFARTGGFPSGITFGPDENFYINVTGTTQRFDGETGERIDTFVPDKGGFPNFFPAPAGDAEGEFINPRGDYSLLERIPGGFRRTLTDRTVHIFNDQNKLASRIDRNGNVTSYTYDALGNIAKITDPVGQETVFAYADGRVTSITDPANRVTALDYDERGNLIRITDPDQTSRSFEYDSEHHMISETDKRGNQEYDFFDEFGRLNRAVLADGSEINIAPRQVLGLYSSERTSSPFVRPNAIRTQGGNSTYVDQNGNATITHLDEAGQEITSVDAIGTMPIIRRDPNTNLVKQLVDARGNLSEFTHDSSGNVISIAEAIEDAKARLFSFDPVFNQLTSSTDELGRTTLFEIDSTNGNMIAETRVIGDFGGGDDIRRTFTYEARGLPETVTDSLGRVSKMEYDSVGRVIAQTFALGSEDERSQQFEYDMAGNKTAFIDVFGNHTHYEYDAMNRVTRIVEADPDGAGPETSPIITYNYDAMGELIEITDAEGVTLRYEYDAVGRQIRSVDSHGNDSTLVYDNGGNLVSVIDADGNQTRHVYDARNRLLETIDPDGARSRFAYDLDDNRTSVIDSAGNETRFEFDSRGHIVREIGPLGAEFRYDYDGANNVILQHDGNGRQIQREYDELNRLTRESWVGGGNEIRYTYDDVGNLTSAIDNFSSITMTYNQLEQVVRIDTSGTPHMPSVVLNFEYNDDGRVVSIADSINGDSQGIQSYEYDSLGRVQRVQQSGVNVSPKSVEFTYNAVGQATTINRYADLANRQFVARSTYTYDALHRVENLQHENATEQISSFNYQYDSLSRTTITKSNEGTAGYTYDDLGRLLTANYDNVDRIDESFAYDANGNRTSTNLGTYSVGQNNQIKSDAQFEYHYDAQGNLSERVDMATANRREFRWDFRDRLIALIDKDAAGKITQQFEYTYDALNRRISSRNVSENTLTTYVYTGDNVLLEFLDEDGPELGADAKLSQRYLFAPAVDMILAQESNGTVTWHLTDRQGSVTELIDSSGAIVNNFVYDAYGKPMDHANPAFSTRYLFSGREYDVETGLYYNRRRFYDPSLGRFISPDPIGFSGGTRNLYEYVGNAPIGRRDPDGLEGDLAQQTSTRQHTSDLLWGLGEIAMGALTFDQGRIGSAVNAGLGGIRHAATDFGRLFGGSNGQSNAFQHAMWQALLAYKYGKERAKEIGDKHESQIRKSCGGQRRDTEADLKNNEKGREIGDKVRKMHPNQSEITPDIMQEIANEIFDAARAGELDFGGGGAAPGAGPNGGAPGGGLFDRGGTGFIGGTPINSRPNVR